MNLEIENSMLSCDTARQLYLPTRAPPTKGDAHMDVLGL